MFVQARKLLLHLACTGGGDGGDFLASEEKDDLHHEGQHMHSSRTTRPFHFLVSTSPISTSIQVSASISSLPTLNLRHPISLPRPHQLPLYPLLLMHHAPPFPDYRRHFALKFILALYSYFVFSGNSLLLGQLTSAGAGFIPYLLST